MQVPTYSQQLNLKVTSAAPEEATPVTTLTESTGPQANSRVEEARHETPSPGYPSLPDVSEGYSDRNRDEESACSPSVEGPQGKVTHPPSMAGTSIRSEALISCVQEAIIKADQTLTRPVKRGGPPSQRSSAEGPLARGHDAMSTDQAWFSEHQEELQAAAAAAAEAVAHIVSHPVEWSSGGAPASIASPRSGGMGSYTGGGDGDPQSTADSRPTAAHHFISDSERRRSGSPAASWSPVNPQSRSRPSGSHPLSPISRGPTFSPDSSPSSLIKGQVSPQSPRHPAAQPSSAASLSPPMQRVRLISSSPLGRASVSPSPSADSPARPRGSPLGIPSASRSMAFASPSPPLRRPQAAAPSSRTATRSPSPGGWGPPPPLPTSAAIKRASASASPLAAGSIRPQYSYAATAAASRTAVSHGLLKGSGRSPPHPPEGLYLFLKRAPPLATWAPSKVSPSRTSRSPSPGPGWGRAAMPSKVNPSATSRSSPGPSWGRAAPRESNRPTASPSIYSTRPTPSTSPQSYPLRGSLDLQHKGGQTNNVMQQSTSEAMSASQTLDSLQEKKRQRLEALAKKVDIRLLLSTIARTPPLSDGLRRVAAEEEESSNDKPVSSHPVVLSEDGSSPAGFGGDKGPSSRLEALAKKIDIKLLLSALLRSSTSDDPQSSSSLHMSLPREALKALSPSAPGEKRPSVELVDKLVQTAIDKEVQTIEEDLALLDRHILTGAMASSKDLVVESEVGAAVKDDERRRPVPSRSSSREAAVWDASTAASPRGRISPLASRSRSTPEGWRDSKPSEPSRAAVDSNASNPARSPGRSPPSPQSRLSSNGRLSSGGGYALRHLTLKSSPPHKQSEDASVQPATNDDVMMGTRSSEEMSMCLI